MPQQQLDDFCEILTSGLALRCAGRLLAGGHSDFQRWEVWQTEAFGRLYRLDECSMAAEADSFLCHEPLVHIGALAHPNPRRALILGGGDGASAAELLKYPGMAEVVLAEQDPAVVKLAREFLGTLHAGALESPQLTLAFGDAADYVRQWQPENGHFDLIIFDLTDPDSAAAPLFGTGFFHACKRLLSPQGGLSLHLGSPLWQREQAEALLERLREHFSCVTPFFTHIPLYGGLWSMALASDALDPVAQPKAVIAARIEALFGAPLRLINASQYHALLVCPPWLESFEGL